MRGDGSPFDLEPTGHDAAPAPGSRGVLLVHGFTGSPFEMRYLGERLAERGFRAFCPLLPGHGTTPRDLARTTWSDWYGAVESGLDTLLESCARVVVVGQSLGGLLALHLASQRGDDLVAAASLAAPLWLTPMARSVVALTHPGRAVGRALGRLVPYLPKVGGSDTRDTQAARENPCYHRIPVSALHQLVGFMGVVRRELEEVETPTLVMHARQDHTAPFECSLEIARRVARGQHRTLDASYHNITIDVERETVAHAVADFFESQLAAPGGQRSRPASAPAP